MGNSPSSVDEIRTRYASIDRGRLMSLVGILNSDELIAAQRCWVEDALSVGEFSRESMWTEIIAVGSRRFDPSSASARRVVALGEDRSAVRKT